MDEISGGVRFIIKTLIKVPIIIFVSFLVLNIFGFFFIYFKILGISYVIMQTAVENNYIPQSEMQVLSSYVKEIEDIEFVDSASIIIGRRDDGTYVRYNVDSDGLDGNYGTAKQQYGREVTVGIACDFTFVWPLTQKQVTGGVDGVGSSKTSTPSDAQIEQMWKDNHVQNNIEIAFTVPGLKYYPDMLSR